MRCSAWFVLLLATIDVASPLRASKAVARPGALRRPRWQISRGGGDEKEEKKPGAAGKIGGALKRVEPVTRCYLVTVLICTVIHQLAGDEAVKVGCARAPPASTLARTPLFLTKCAPRAAAGAQIMSLDPTLFLRKFQVRACVRVVDASLSLT